MSRQIMVGGVAVGGGAPVSIQSMCNTATEDVEATVQQILRLEQAGCEIIRVAVPHGGGGTGRAGHQGPHPHPAGGGHPFRL